MNFEDAMYQVIRMGRAMTRAAWPSSTSVLVRGADVVVVDGDDAPSVFSATADDRAATDWVMV